MTTLYLCEKPSQAKEVAEALGLSRKTDGAYMGDGVIVTNAVGHLLEHAEPASYGAQFEKWSLDSLPCIPDPWQSVLKTSTQDQFSTIERLLKTADSIVIATDADREGEVIARNILEYANCKKPIQRLWVQETTPSGYKKGIAKMKNGEAYESLYYSGVGRGRADWLSGMNITRALTTSFSVGGKGNVLHFGRVQTPTLALIVFRERAIANFKAIDHFSIKGEFSINNQAVKMGLQLLDEWVDASGRLVDKTLADKIVTACESANNSIAYFNVTKYETKEEREPAPLPYYLGSLQKDCAKQLGIRPDKVLEICQSLYDAHKLISYPRTEGEYIPTQIFEESTLRLNAIKSIDPSLASICDLADTENAPRAFNDKLVEKGGGHFAIIPTDKANFNVSNLSADELQVYDLIRRRYIAQFLGYYVFDKTDLEVKHDAYVFKASGRVPKNDGWKRAYPKANTADENAEVEPTLPNTEIGANAAVLSIKADALKTKPPARYTAGSLLTAMESIDKEIDDPRLAAIMKGKEKAGIGTNATRAEVIKKLFDGSYIEESKKYIVPTDKGNELVTLLEKGCPALVDLALTAEWEDKLSLVETGELSLSEFEHSINDFVRECITKIKTAKANGAVGLIGTVENPCPSCGKGMIRRKSDKGFWWGCSSYPVCKHTMNDKDGKPFEKPASFKSKTATASSEYKCQTCEKPLIRRKADKGYFWGCTGYPECTTTYVDYLGKPKFK